jgi:hypothetical protein
MKQSVDEQLLGGRSAEPWTIAFAQRALRTATVMEMGLPSVTANTALLSHLSVSSPA